MPRNDHIHNSTCDNVKNISSPATKNQNTMYPLPTTVEQSLEEWLNRSSPSSPSSLLLETCRCCGQSDCDSLQRINKTIKKLESDARLAAEIGQSILEESNRRVSSLQSQLDESRIRLHELEQILQESEAANRDLNDGKVKLARGCQKTQQALDEIVKDLELANAKCAELSNDLECKNVEVEKLRIFKIMVRQADIREEALRSKLEDTRQELAISRRNEMILEARQKKLRTRWESLSAACEKSGEGSQETRAEGDVEWLRTYNEKLKADILKLTSNVAPANDMSNQLVSVIKELVSANSKLKSDLLTCREQLSETQSDLIALNGRLEEMETPIDLQPTRNNIPLLDAGTPDRSRRLKSPVRRTSSVRETKKAASTGKKPLCRTKTLPPPIPSVSVSQPTNSAVIHHHYHHYVIGGKKKRNEKDASKKILETEDPAKTEQNLELLPPKREGDVVQIFSEPMSCSPSSSTTTTMNNNCKDNTKIPYCVLESHVSQVLERLRGTDIRALNRRLRRAFDMLELSNMSNSIIENILVDIDTLDTRFAWLRDTLSSSEKKPIEETALEYFFLIVRLFQDALKEIGQLRMTMNELQVEYVKKVEESGLRAEEEIIRKRHMEKSEEKHTSPLAWLTSMFYRAAAAGAPKPMPRRTLLRSASSDDLSARSTRDRSTLAKTLTTMTIHGDEEAVERYLHRAKSDRFGPPSSFPRAIGEKSCGQPTMRASQSTGSIRRRQPGRAKPLTLRNPSPSASTSWDIPRPSSPGPGVEWKVASGPYSSSWLGVGSK
ncbi:hypothetical protein EC973_009427 [Apophysomyces ossiformis]|uniref:Uncharacterized protein n=1 Tax=Apophysomyces ossiformis TaxID=679940 RepID=A0A8H7ESZ9_9FUNG|nr:hypothetical protein EC973_009427 [Apophysomyces ossiformis]